MRDITLDYIAGFSDGEGYLGIRKHTTPNCKLGFRYQLVVKIAQLDKHRNVLEAIQSKYGGHISKQRLGGNRRPCVMWELSNTKLVSKFLDDMEEKLIIKSPQLKLLQEFITVGKITTRIPNKIEKQRNDIYQKRKELYDKCLKINRRGLAETE